MTGKQFTPKERRTEASLRKTYSDFYRSQEK